MNILYTIMLTFIATTYIVVGIIERECEWKNSFVRTSIIMPSISIHCALRTEIKND